MNNTVEQFKNFLIMQNIDNIEEKLDKFKTFYELVIQQNKVMNLTAITDYEQFYNKHFYDSIYWTKLFSIPTNSSIADIGAGAGFPSIPLAIIFTKNTFTLIEPIGKRANFLTKVKFALKLNNVEIINKRAEELDYLKEKFDFTISRAVANNYILEELSIPLLKVNGKMIQLKGSNLTTEYYLPFRQKNLFISKPKIISYQIIDNSNRNLVLVTKLAKTPDIYPRNFGIIKKEFTKLQSKE